MRKLAILPAATALLCACISVAPESRVVTSPAAAPVAPSPPPEPEVRVTPPPPAPSKPVRAAAVRIDNASLATFRATWQQLYDSLSPAERTKLHNAVALIAFSPYRDVTELPLNLTRSPIVPEMIRGQIDGLTYPQIVELSKRADRSEPTPP